MNFNIIAERFKRLDKITVLLSILILFITYYIVVRVAPLLIYFLDMLGLGNNTIYNIIIFTRDYLVIPLIMMYYIISILYGYWDLKFMCILRMLEKPNKYRKVSEELIDDIEIVYIYKENIKKELYLTEIEKEWKENSDRAFIEINGCFTVFKDLRIQETDKLTENNILIRRESYQYIGKKLLCNKNIVSNIFYLEARK